MLQLHVVLGFQWRVHPPDHLLAKVKHLAFISPNLGVPTPLEHSLNAKGWVKLHTKTWVFESFIETQCLVVSSHNIIQLSLYTRWDQE